MRDAMDFLVGSPVYNALISDQAKIDAIKKIRGDFIEEAKRQMITPGSKYFDSDLFAWTIRAKVQEPLGIPFAP